jgi:hypothetical protein
VVGELDFGFEAEFLLIALIGETVLEVEGVWGNIFDILEYVLVAGGLLFLLGAVVDVRLEVLRLAEGQTVSAVGFV